MARPAINRAMREAVASRYGAEPGDIIHIGCYYCRALIWIDWSDHRRVRFLDRDDRPFPELDHVEPLFWGGAHSAENLVPACRHCNRSKGPRRLVTAS